MDKYDAGMVREDLIAEFQTPSPSPNASSRHLKVAPDSQSSSHSSPLSSQKRGDSKRFASTPTASEGPLQRSMDSIMETNENDNEEDGKRSFKTPTVSGGRELRKESKSKLRRPKRILDDEDDIAGKNTIYCLSLWTGTCFHHDL